MAKHVHAELIKAWADGAQIEVKHMEDWYRTSNPNWVPAQEYRIEDPYRELKAAAADPTKQIRCRQGDWVDGDIEEAEYHWKFTAPVEHYEIRDKPDPYRELKAATADPTKEIRINSANHTGRWENGDAHGFTLPPEDYEIRDKPKTKVKMWLWVCRRRRDGGYWRTGSYYPSAPSNLSSSDVIGPALQTEIEVDAP